MVNDALKVRAPGGWSHLRPNTGNFRPSGNARCNRSCSASRCRSAGVGGSGPQHLLNWGRVSPDGDRCSVTVFRSQKS